MKDSFRFVSTMAKGASPAHMFEHTADKFPDKAAVIYEDKPTTFRQMEEAANQTVRN